MDTHTDRDRREEVANCQVAKKYTCIIFTTNKIHIRFYGTKHLYLY